MKFRRSGGSGLVDIIRSRSSSSFGSKSHKSSGAVFSEPVSNSNANSNSAVTDTIMDLTTTITPSNSAGFHAGGPSSTSSSSRIMYRMEGSEDGDENSNINNKSREEEEVERIVSAVTKGLRKSPSSSRTKSSKASRTASTRTSSSKKSPKRQQGSNRDRASSNQRGSSKTAKPQTRTSSSAKTLSPPRTKPRKKPSARSRGVEVVPIVSDDESASAASSYQEQSGFPGFLHRMMFDESMETASSTLDGKDEECDYNYIDDESYGNTTYSGGSSRDSGSSYTSSSSSSSFDKRKENESYNDSIVEESFDTSRGSYGSRADKDENNKKEDEFQMFHVPRNNGSSSSNNDKNSPSVQGLDIVANLLSGAKEVHLDMASVASSGNAQAPEVARHIAETIAQTTSLQKVSFCGSWSRNNNNCYTLSKSSSKQVLDILFRGVLANTSVHTLVLRDNHNFDRHAGWSFGTMLKSHNNKRIQKLEVVNCQFVGSGWNSLFLGIQHSSSIKRLSVEGCNNLSSVEVDGISSTIRYLRLESLRLCGIQLHKVDIDSLAFLLQSIQQTTTLKDVDLSHNNLGGVPRLILLLSKCLAGDPVRIEGSNNGTHNTMNHNDDDEYLPQNYKHHIERLILIDCGITHKSSVKSLANALDNTHPAKKLGANGDEHPLAITTVDLSKNRFGNSGAKVLYKLLELNPKITTLGMVGCNASASRLKEMADRLRYNNSFLQKIGLSSDVSLAILDSVSAVEHAFGGGGTTDATAMVSTKNGDSSDIETTSRLCAC